MDSLSSRYQIRENMRTAKTMFIATIIYIISSIVHLTGELTLKRIRFPDIVHFAVFKVNRLQKL